MRALLRLFPLSGRETAGQPHKPAIWEHQQSESTIELNGLSDLWNRFLKGGYPELAIDPERNFELWHASYIQTYLERDIRMLRQVGDLTQYQLFLRAIAARSGQLLNMTSLGRDLGIAVNTVKAWLSILEATYQVTVLRPYPANVGKRLVKTPKVYFSDVGTLCYLVGLKDPIHAMSRSNGRGNL